MGTGLVNERLIAEKSTTMKKTLLLICACAFVMSVYAQDETIRNLRTETERKIERDEKDTIQKRWKKGGIYGINVSQGSLNNWAAGGDDFSLSINSILSLFAFFKEGKHSWDNTLDFNLGYVKTSSLGSRKNDDRFDILSKYGYALNPKLNLAGLVNFRSQFFNGYTYNDDVQTFSSAFLSPAYLLVSIGLDYKPVPELSIFVSPITSRWTIVKNDELSNRGLYGVDSGRHSNNELGAFASVNYLKEFNKNVSYKARLDLFSNYKNNPQNVDLFMSNVLNVKLGGIFTATWSVDLIYDDDAKLFGENASSPALQVKSLVGLGLQLRF